MKTLNYLPWITCCFISIGCEVNYEITMKPVDGGLKRKTVASGLLDQFEKDSLTNVYGQHWVEPNKSRGGGEKVLVWEGVVNSEWKDGIGGLGTWTDLTSPLGSVKIYMESFGGDVRIAEYIETLFIALEAAEEEIQKHFEDTLAQNPLLPKMQTLLHDRILTDAKDLALMIVRNLDYLGNVYTFNERGTESDQIKFIISFLWQREWISDTTASTLLHSYNSLNEEYLGKKILSNALGIKLNNSSEALQFSKLITALTPLFSEEYTISLWNNMEETITANGYDFQQFFIINQQLLRTIGFKYELFARFESETKPTITNGKWKDQSNTVTFTMDSIPQGAGYFAPPILWHAAWEFPNTKYQERIFGEKIIVDDLMLFNAAWVEGIETARSKVNTFLTLRGQDRAAGRPWKTKDILSECMMILRNFNHDKDK